MPDTTIRRDAEGRVALTTEQAEALALPLPVDVADPYADLRAAIIDAGDVPYRALTRWVLLNAPVVRAAEAQTDVADAIRHHDWTEYDEGLAFAAADTSRATEAAVRAARPQPQEDTDA